MDSEIYERKNETITGDREDWLGFFKVWSNTFVTEFRTNRNSWSILSNESEFTIDHIIYKHEMT